MSEFSQFSAMLERARVRNAKLLLEAATLLRDEHIRDLGGVNADGTNPATKGEFPKQRTGDLRHRVVMEPATLDEIMKTGKVRVGLKAGPTRPSARSKSAPRPTRARSERPCARRSAPESSRL